MPEPDTAQSAAKAALDDLAFMRALVEDAGKSQQVVGAVFVLGGLAYGVQALAQGVDALGWVRYPPLLSLLVAWSGTLALMAGMPAIIWRNRGAPKGGTAARAFNAAFTALGCTNLVVIFIVGVLAARLKSFAVWELYPAIVFALQGAGWLFAYFLARRAWRLAVALGWFGAAAALGWWIASPAYIAICGVGLIVLMAGPGFVLMRQAPTRRRAA